MKAALRLFSFLLLFVLPGFAWSPQEPAAAGRFQPIDVYVDAGRAALAAWQVELSYDPGRAKLVGIEGGEHPAFSAAPHYDPAALAAFRASAAGRFRHR